MQLVFEDAVSLSVNCLIVNRYHKKRSVFVNGKEGNEKDAEDDDDDIDNADNHVWEWPAVIASPAGPIMSGTDWRANMSPQVHNSPFVIRKMPAMFTTPRE